MSKYLLFLFFVVILWSCADVKSVNTNPGSLNEECYKDKTCDGDLECHNNKCITKVDLCKQLTCKSNENCVVENKKAICVCNSDFHSEDSKCVSDTKKDTCIDNAPENGESKIRYVDIIWSKESSSWSEPSICEWICKEGFKKDGEFCKLNTDRCDDGLFCTQNDTLDAQNICKGVVKDCNDNNEDTIDSCDEENDICINTPKTGECDDGLFCTINDNYDALGVCVGTPNFCDDNDDSTIDSCDEENDICKNTIRENACDDGLFCTINDTLNDSNECTGDINLCDDGDETTVDSCNEDSDICEHTPRVGPCNDGLFCTIDDIYNENGICVGTLKDCDDEDDLTIDSCNVENGICEHAPRTGSCDDELFCTINDTYNESGVCVGTPNLCDDGDEMTVDSCDEDVNLCNHTPRTGSCDDNLFCTINDTYNEGGVCIGTPNLCDDSNENTIDSCDEESDLCNHTPRTGNCDDGLFCTINDNYNANGVCVGTPNLCNDNNEGTIDSCDENNDRCDNTPRTGSCDDGLFCTVNDHYNANGFCIGDINICNDNNDGTIDSCNENSNQCVNTIRTGSCDDGQFCTMNDHYNASGICIGVPKDCNDNNEGTVDSCNDVTNQCVNTIRSGACDDNKYCTFNDTYNNNGVCNGTPTNCNDSNSQTYDSCNETYNSCVNAVLCNDSNGYSIACANNENCVGNGSGNYYCRVEAIANEICGDGQGYSNICADGRGCYGTPEYGYFCRDTAQVNQLCSNGTDFRAPCVNDISCYGNNNDGYYCREEVSLGGECYNANSGFSAPCQNGLTCSGNPTDGYFCIN